MTHDLTAKAKRDAHAQAQEWLDHRCGAPAEDAEAPCSGDKGHFGPHMWEDWRWGRRDGPRKLRPSHDQ